MKAIELFDKGKMWERGTMLIKELREDYQYQTFEYDKLTQLLDLHAELVKKILAEQRFFAEYYRVGYYGKGFDSNLSVRLIISDLTQL
jgi:dedicator of cytokinesis protein 1